MRSRTESAVGSSMSSTIRPSARNTARSAYEAAIGSWVTITIVWPNSRTAVRMNERISAPVRESRLPVGSSAKMISGSAGQGAGDGDALLLAAGELGRAVLEAVPQADGLDHVVEPSRVGLAAGKRAGQGDVLGRGQRRHQVERLEDEADPVAAELRELAVVELRDVGVADQHGAGGEVVEAGDAVHQRRLARAGRAHDGGEAAGAELDGDAVEGAHLALAAAVDLDGVEHAGGGQRGSGRGWRRHGCWLVAGLSGLMVMVMSIGSPERCGWRIAATICLTGRRNRRPARRFRRSPGGVRLEDDARRRPRGPMRRRGRFGTFER